MNEITGTKIFFIPKKIDYNASMQLKKDLVAHYLNDSIILGNSGWTFYATTSNRGRCNWPSKTITIPVWAMIKSNSFKAWYIAHEMAHAFAGPRALHGPAFMLELKRICPDNAIHHELGYKPQNAKKAGILDCSEI